jgi:KilA domain-containing protein
LAVVEQPKQGQLAFVPHAYQGEVIEQRIGDGYINATAMCKAAGKLFGHYNAATPTKAFLAELSVDIGIPISDLVQVIKGGDPTHQGTWVHPQVAIHLGQWLSPRFAVQVTRWVYDWMSSGAMPSRLPYHLRRYVTNQKNIPEGYFSVLNEITLALIAPLEAQGYTLPESLWPDISQGLMFAKWLREEKGLVLDATPTYVHEFDDGRPPVLARAYPNELLPDFRKHFTEVWLRRRSERYFKERDAKALGYLPKVLPSPLPKKVLKREIRKPINAD